MRARIAQMSSLRKVVATECCVVGVALAIAVLLAGATPLAVALLAGCALAMSPALVALARLERRGGRD